MTSCACGSSVFRRECAVKAGPRGPRPRGGFMSWLVGQSSALGEVAAKAVLMYVTALVALRLGERRTLAQWTVIDFATAVAMGAIIGRSAIAGSQSYLT